jgi:hypothetical protein
MIEVSGQPYTLARTLARRLLPAVPHGFLHPLGQVPEELSLVVVAHRS